MTLRREVETTRLEFGEDWIDVRSERLYGDTVAAQRAAATRVQAATKEERASGAATLDFDVSAFNLALLTTMIVAWSDDAPINEDTVQELPNDIAQDVLEVILADRGEEEKGPLGKTSTLSLVPPEESGQPEEETLAGHEE